MFNAKDVLSVTDEECQQGLTEVTGESHQISKTGFTKLSVGKYGEYLGGGGGGGVSRFPGDLSVVSDESLSRGRKTALKRTLRAQGWRRLSRNQNAKKSSYRGSLLPRLRLNK